MLENNDDLYRFADTFERIPVSCKALIFLEGEEYAHAFDLTTKQVKTLVNDMKKDETETGWVQFTTKSDDTIVETYFPLRRICGITTVRKE